MSQENIRVLGHGYWGKKIHQTLQKISKGEIIVFDKFPASTSDIKVQPIEKLDDFLNSQPNEKSFFFIATPEQTHFPLVKKLLENNQHVFVEKPLSLTKVEAKELINIAQQNDVNVFVDRIFLYDQGYQKVKKLLSENTIGKNQKN